MYPPRTLTLHLDQSGTLQHWFQTQTPADLYAEAIEILTLRAAPAGAHSLENRLPLIVSAIDASLTIAPVSGTPHLVDPTYQPISINRSAFALLAKRGDHFIACLTRDNIRQQAFLFASYDISPQIEFDSRPIVRRDPACAPIADHDSLTLMRIVQERELRPVEQFFAAYALPNIWSRFAGPTVPPITTPTDPEIAECRGFAEHFTAPDLKLQALASAWPGWTRVLSTDTPANLVRVLFDAQPATPAENFSPTPPKPRLRM